MRLQHALACVCYNPGAAPYERTGFVKLVDVEVGRKLVMVGHDVLRQAGSGLEERLDFRELTRLRAEIEHGEIGVATMRAQGKLSLDATLGGQQAHGFDAGVGDLDAVRGD